MLRAALKRVSHSRGRDHSLRSPCNYGSEGWVVLSEVNLPCGLEDYVFNVEPKIIISTKLLFWMSKPLNLWKYYFTFSYFYLNKQDGRGSTPLFHIWRMALDVSDISDRLLHRKQLVADDWYLSIESPPRPFLCANAEEKISIKRGFKLFGSLT